jgi:hypothetical protein
MKLDSLLSQKRESEREEKKKKREEISYKERKGSNLCDKETILERERERENGGRLHNTRGGPI